MEPKSNPLIIVVEGSTALWGMGVMRMAVMRTIPRCHHQIYLGQYSAVSNTKLPVYFEKPSRCRACSYATNHACAYLRPSWNLGVPNWLAPHRGTNLYLGRPAGARLRMHFSKQAPGPYCKSGVKVGILNTKVARMVRAGQTFPLCSWHLLGWVVQVLQEFLKTTDGSSGIKQTVFYLTPLKTKPN